LRKYRYLFECNECSSEFVGERCEFVRGPCQPTTCWNNGTCNNRSSILKFVSKSFGYVSIIFLLCTVAFFVVMDVLKYCFGIDPTKQDLERIRRQKAIERAKKNRKPVIQKFTYVNAPPPPTTTNNNQETNV